MNSNFTLLDKSALRGLPESTAGQTPNGPVAPIAEYTGLIRRLFDGRSVVVVVGSGFEDVARECDKIAAELAASGKRVVVADAERLLKMNPEFLPEHSAPAPGPTLNVWKWPCSSSQQIEFLKKLSPVHLHECLDFLRRSFDSVLLCCPTVESVVGIAGISGIAAIADTAVLVVEARGTPKQRIQSDQSVLRSSGINLAGCILVRRR